VHFIFHWIVKSTFDVLILFQALLTWSIPGLLQPFEWHIAGKR